MKKIVRRLVDEVVGSIPIKSRAEFKTKFPKTYSRILYAYTSLTRGENNHDHARLFDQEADRRGTPTTIGERTSGSPKVRIYSPLAPTLSGIASFTQSFADALSAFTEVGLRSSFFANRRETFEPGVRSFLYEEPQDDQDQPVNLYMLGNGPHHESTWLELLEKPGYVMVHDAKIPYLPVAKTEDRLWLELSESERADWYLGRLPSHTLGIFTMSEETKMLVQKQFTEGQLRSIPVHTLSTSMPSRKINSQPRQTTIKPRIGTFGFQNDQKHSILAMEYISRVAAELGGSAVVCGSAEASLVRKMKQIWELAGNAASDLSFEANLNDEEFHKCMSDVDFAVQFRKWSNGETSAVIPQLASLGIPTAVNPIGSFKELNSDLFIFVDPMTDNKNVHSFQGSVLEALELLRSSERYLARSKALIQWAQSNTFDVAAFEVLEIISNKHSEKS
jgi:hypothetical protein